jgi:hypothetical protein
MRLLTSSKTVLPGSGGYGLRILGRVPLSALRSIRARGTVLLHTSFRLCAGNDGRGKRAADLGTATSGAPGP